jgi:sugar/nucleoside kinase (ribokinase family)
MGDAPKENTFEAPESVGHDISASTHVPARTVERNRTMNGQDAQREIMCVGETLWDLYVPAGTPLVETNHVFFEPGGSATNVARQLAKLGVRAGIVGVVGDDPLGAALVERLTREGVDVRHIHKMSARTGLVLISNDPPVAVAYRAADEEAQAFRYALNGEYSAQIVHFSSLLPNRTALHALAKSAQRARKAGSAVMVDANLRPRLWRGDAAAKTNPYEVLEVADVVKVSVDDLKVLGVEDPQVLRDKLRPEAILIVTSGAGPTRAWSARGMVEVDVVKLDVPMAVGAGDAFVAGCLSTMLDLHPRLWATLSELEGIIARGNAIARSALENLVMRQATSEADVFGTKT